MLVLVVRLWILQIVDGAQYKRKSEINRIETVFITPPRGHITDRNGKLFVSNRPSFNIEVTRESVADFELMWNILAPVLGIERKELISRFTRNAVSRRRYEPILIARDVSREVVARIVTERFRLPGVRINALPIRDYPYGALATQSLGIVREINAQQLAEGRYSTYRSGDVVGQSGIEHQWEEYLRGVRGRQQVIVNATGWRVGELASEQEAIGNTVETTLDLELQHVAEEQLQDKAGAIVAMNVNNGEILAMASSPGYDPGMFGKELTKSDWAFISSNRRMLNRAVQGAYPPGSTFKTVLALAGLSENMIKPQDTVTCKGGYYFAGRYYRCWRKGGHGNVNLRQALRSSCDVYFYILGQRLGIDRIYQYANFLGLGELTGIGLNFESAGVLPSREWKKRYFKKPQDKTWFPGETLSVAIGQGAVTTTPLQMVRAYAAIANGGKVVQPRIVRRVISREGHVVVDFTRPTIKKEISIDPVHQDMIKEALQDVVHAPQGTGAGARLDSEYGIFAAGKTGTAQVVDLKYHGKKGHYEDHAWFVGFAPVKESEIAVAVLIEHGGHGGSSAAPAFKEVVSAYFSPRLKSNKGGVDDKKVKGAM
jgi:penicillin-binding protein 2